VGNLESIGRAILSLALVVGLMWLLGRWARGRGRGRRGARKREGLEVLARQQLTRGASVAVVRIGDRGLIVGVTDGQVSLLGEVAPTEFDVAPVLTAVRADEQPWTEAVPARVAATSGSRRRAAAKGLEGSALSLATWSQALDALRDRTARH
jgi:flagellar protein FliO/FliZ